MVALGGRFGTLVGGKLGGVGLISNRPDAQAIPDALRTEISLLNHWSVSREQRWLRPLHDCESS